MPLSFTPHRLRLTVSWLFTTQSHVWLCLFVTSAAIFVLFLPEATERLIRCTGLTLQLAGVLTVVWGVTSTRRLLGLTSLRCAFWNWFNACPLIVRAYVGRVSSATVTATSSSPRAYVSLAGRTHESIESRLAEIEGALDTLAIDQQGFDERVRTRIDALHETVAPLLTAQREAQSALAAKFQGYGLSGLRVSAIGAVWLFVGSILATLSNELLSLVQ